MIQHKDVYKSGTGIADPDFFPLLSPLQFSVYDVM